MTSPHFRPAAGLMLFAGAFIALACLPQRHEYVGAPCNNMHPCPAPLFCVASTCAEALPFDAGTDAGSEDAGAPDSGSPDAGVQDAGVRLNLFPNPSFEDTTRPIAVDWSTDGTFENDLQVARTGHGSLKLGATVTELHSASVAITFQPNAGLFCVEAWLNGSGTGNVSLAYTGASLMSQVSPDRPEAHATLTPGGWVAVRTRLNVSQPVVSELRLTLRGPAWVDDVAVWHSANMTCDER